MCILFLKLEKMIIIVSKREIKHGVLHVTMLQLAGEGEKEAEMKAPKTNSDG
jgi:hypothetical protein